MGLEIIGDGFSFDRDWKRDGSFRDVSEERPPTSWVVCEDGSWRPFRHRFATYVGERYSSHFNVTVNWMIENFGPDRRWSCSTMQAGWLYIDFTDRAMATLFKIQKC